MGSIYSQPTGDDIWQSRLDALLADSPDVQARIMQERDWTPQQVTAFYFRPAKKKLSSMLVESLPELYRRLRESPHEKARAWSIHMRALWSLTEHYGELSRTIRVTPDLRAQLLAEGRWVVDRCPKVAFDYRYLVDLVSRSAQPGMQASS